MTRAALALAVALIAAACTNAISTSAPSLDAADSSAMPTAAMGNAPSSYATPFPSADDFASFVASLAAPSEPALGAIDEYWQRVWSEYLPSSAAYQPVARVVAYRGGVDLPHSVCATGTSVRFWAANARYCAPDESIYFDEGWLRDLSQATSTFAIGAILAHEWGHHIQQLQHTSGYQIQMELQADCFAGMFLGGREKYELGNVNATTDELDTGLATMFSIGNRRYSSSEWMSPVEHGSSLQRVMAYGTGWLGTSGEITGLGSLGDGYEWCAGYGMFAPSSTTAIGPYRLLNIPGRAAQVSSNGISVPAPADAAVPPSSLFAAWLPAISLPSSAAGASMPVNQLAAAINAVMPGSTAVAAPSEFSTSAGDGWIVYVERHPDARSVESGLVYVLGSSASGGSLVIAATQPQPAATQLDRDGYARLFEHISSLAEFANRLCGPGDSAASGEQLANVACAEDQ